MSLDTALQLISQLSSGNLSVVKSGSVYSAGGKNYISDKKAFDKANKIALDIVAAEAVNMVKRWLGVGYPPSSLPGEPPRSRTGTLRDSIHWRAGKVSREFPGPPGKTISDMKRFAAKSPQEWAWYKKIMRDAYKDRSLITPYPKRSKRSTQVRVIEVDPNAPDKTEGSRLEYYSYYLETGWYSTNNDFHNDKGQGKNKGTPYKRERAKRNKGATGPKWNPPRPYLSRLAWPANKQRLEQIYRTALKVQLNLISPGMGQLADKATLTVVFNRTLRVPYLSGNQGLLR